jgi:hypothetical protein
MRTQPDTMVKEYDGTEGTCIAADLQQDITTPGYPWFVRVSANPHVMAGDTRAYLDPATARALARHLAELADEADSRNDETEDRPTVPMVCTTCRQPVSPSGTAWLHDSPADARTCSALRVTPDTPVKAMVAAGNENVPAGE